MYRVEYNDDASELYLRRSLHHRARPFSFSQCININVRTFPEETSRFHEGKIELIVRIDSTLITSGCREMGNNNDRTETISFLLLLFLSLRRFTNFSLSLHFILSPFLKQGTRIISFVAIVLLERFHESVALRSRSGET